MSAAAARLVSAGVLVGLSVGCAPDREPIAVLDPFGLEPVPASDDPLAEHRPPWAECPVAAWGPEGGGFEIQTGVCAYGAFAQPLGVDLSRGDALRVSIWHDLLDAPEPATGHVAVLLGREVVWEAEVAIPAASAALEATIELEEDVDADERLGIHLHNHGFNSWRVVAVDAVP